MLLIIFSATAAILFPCLTFSSICDDLTFTMANSAATKKAFNKTKKSVSKISTIIDQKLMRPNIRYFLWREMRKAAFADSLFAYMNVSVLISHVVRVRRFLLRLRSCQVTKLSCITQQLLSVSLSF